MAQRGLLRTKVEKAYSLAEAKAAIAHASQAKRSGKIVFRFEAGDMADARAVIPSPAAAGRGTSQPKWWPLPLPTEANRSNHVFVTFALLGSNNSRPRSFHLGFKARTNSFFFSLRHPLISFSRVMAHRASLNRS